MNSQFSLQKLKRNMQDTLAKLLPTSSPEAQSAPSPATPDALKLNIVAGPTPKPRLLVEGWRGINHSYALVNQYHLYEWAQANEPQVYHRDMPLLFAHWQPQAPGAGFPEAYAAQIARIPTWQGEAYDACFRIHAPVTLAPDDRHPVSTFLVTELGLSETQIAGFRANANDYFAAGGSIVTPTRWARDRLVEANIPADRIHVVPHGVAGDIFRPLPGDERAQLRQQFGIAPDEVVFLNVAAPIWNKGLDILMQAFVQCFLKHPNIRLIVKDQEAVYGISSKDAVLRELNALGQGGNNALIGAIRIVSGDLSLPQLRELYCLADYYLSPYRAEGFNLPVIEAIACGTPAIVTQGGATDDFCDATNSLSIDATPQRNITINDQCVNYQAPSPEALLARMEACAQSPAFSAEQRLQSAEAIVRRFTWENAAHTIAHALIRSS